MKEIINKVLKTSKILVLLLVAFSMTKVNVISHNGKISNENLNKTIDLTAMAVKLNEIQMADKYYPLDTFTGDMTGYSADCPLCSGRLGCTGQNVLDGTTTFNDNDYGNVLIVASSKNLPCGSIITFNANFVSKEKSTAIVLDRGVLGNDIDLLVPSEDFARNNIGRHKITYDVLRFGWERKAN